MLGNTHNSNWWPQHTKQCVEPLSQVRIGEMAVILDLIQNSIFSLLLLDLTESIVELLRHTRHPKFLIRSPLPATVISTVKTNCHVTPHRTIPLHTRPFTVNCSDAWLAINFSCMHPFCLNRDHPEPLVVICDDHRRLVPLIAPSAWWHWSTFHRCRI